MPGTNKKSISVCGLKRKCNSELWRTKVGGERGQKNEDMFQPGTHGGSAASRPVLHHNHLLTLTELLFGLLPVDYSLTAPISHLSSRSLLNVTIIVFPGHLCQLRKQAQSSASRWC